LYGCGKKKIEHSATRLLIEYEQAILAKTGYIRNAGFNGVLLAESGNRRLITVMFGGKSTKTMIAQMSKLSTSGFIKPAGGLESDIDKLKPLSSADII
jgi:D-alanyl-D-alanine carboxypeptidase